MEAYEAGGCGEDKFGAAIGFDAFDDAVLAAKLNGKSNGRRKGGGGQPAEEITVLDGVVGSRELIFVPANAPHQVRNEGPVTVAVSMNFVDETNAKDAARALLEAPDYDSRYRARLRKHRPKDGRLETVPGSKALWYERFQMASEREDALALRAASEALVAERRSGKGNAGGTTLRPQDQESLKAVYPLETVLRRITMRRRGL